MTTLLVTERPAIDYDAIKAKQLTTWASGDFGQIGVRLQIVGENLCEAVEVAAGEKVLDVAAGNGNASLAAARRFADVTSTDFVPALLEQGYARSVAERLPIAFQVADAERLPFEDESFDVALSTFGVMFAPNQERAAWQLVRVTKPGGRIGLANWTPEGLIGQMFKVIASFVPPPAGLHSPMEWGTEARLAQLFGGEVSDIHTTRKVYTFTYRSAEHFVEFFRTYYGPTHRAFAALDAERQQAFNSALVEFLRPWNKNPGAALTVPGEYLEVVITK